MKELQDIITTWKQLKNSQTAVATLVKVEGSTYRTPGARMLITTDGNQIGSISGGCLESDVVERSHEVIKSGISTLVKYDTTSEDDMIWGLGLGCQGVAYILIEKLNKDETNVLSLINKCLSTRQAGAIATVFKAEGTKTVKKCDRLLLYPDGSIVSTITNAELEDVVKRNLQLVLQRQKSATQVYALSEGTAEVFLEVIQPPVSLVIFGAGFDVLPLVRFAKELGWYVTVIDPKARLITSERFKICDQVMLGFDQIEAKIKFNEETVVVVMSHNYLDDLEFLQRLIPISLKYLGILGPKKRTNRLLQDLQAEGFIPKPEQELYSPIGLDIGADNPEAIALSIIAEIQAVTQNRQGGFLKNRTAPIHSITDGNSLVASTYPVIK